MSSEPAELHPNTRQIVTALDNLKSGTIAVWLSGISLFVSSLSILLSALAKDDAAEALATVNVELRYARAEIVELKEDIAVRQIRTRRVEEWLRARGVPIEEIVE